MMDRLIPGRPNEPDAALVMQLMVDKLRVSFGKELSPTGTRPATRAALIAAARTIGGE